MYRTIAIAVVVAMSLQVSPVIAAGAAGRAPRAAQAQTATLNGTAQTAQGQSLANYTVRLRNLQTGELTGTTTSNASGQFTFPGLNPGNYVVEVVNPAGTILATSTA